MSDKTSHLIPVEFNLPDNHYKLLEVFAKKHKLTVGELLEKYASEALVMNILRGDKYSIRSKETKDEQQST